MNVRRLCMYCFYPRPLGDGRSAACSECGHTPHDALGARRRANVTWLTVTVGLTTLLALLALEGYRLVAHGTFYVHVMQADACRFIIIGVVLAAASIDRWPVRRSIIVIIVCITTSWPVFVLLVHLLVQIPLVQMFAYLPAVCGCIIINIAAGLAIIMTSTQTILSAANAGA